MKKLNRKGILVLILLLAVGFAAVSTSLIINGTSIFGVNESDFDVYFSYAEIDGEDKSAEIISPNGKSITFVTKNMSFLNEKTMLDFIVTNNSSQYDAKVSVNCIDTESEKVDITYSMVDEIIKAKENKAGNITIELISNTLEEDEIEFTCTIEASAQEREEAGVPSAPENPEAASTYSIYGYLEDEEGNVLPNANLVVYSNTPHYVTTDSRGYFYVEELEAGSHEIYYMGSIETANLTKEEVKEQAIDEVNITTSTKNITFNKGHKITSSKIENTLNREVEIKFDAGDGSVVVEDITGTHNKEYGTLPKPTKEGYTFEKWVYEDGTEVTSETIIPTGSNHTLKAVYQENEYTISYNANQGTGSMESMTQKYTKEVTLTKNTFTRTGYTFAGWSTKSDGTGESYNDEAKVSKLVGTGNITLYAKWTANKYTLKFNANSGSVSETSRSVTYGSAVGELPTPTRTGYTFKGWYTAKTGGTKYESTTKVTFTEETTLYAQWTAITYTVKYNGNGSTGGSTASSSHTYDVAKALTANGFTKAYTVTYNANGGSVTPASASASYTFSGWATSSTGSVAHTDKKSVTNLSSTANATVNLYAVWTGGKLASLPTPTRTGYTFNGWYTAASGGTKITTSTVFTKATTVYAQWKINSYNVGQVVNIGSEKFNIISSNSTTVTMLASNALGKNYRQTTSTSSSDYGVKFADSKGWAYTPGPKEIDIQAFDGNAKTYINNYVSYLKTQTGDSSLTGTLITLKELGTLGCTISANYLKVDGTTCVNSNNASWLINGQAWRTRSAGADNSTGVWTVFGDGRLINWDYLGLGGVRPVITISKNALK